MNAGPVSTTGTHDVKIGPNEYQNFWKEEVGYQRPIESVTVRLGSMAWVLSNFDEYVPDQSVLDWRGATTFDFNETEQYKEKKRHENPLGLADPYCRIRSR